MGRDVTIDQSSALALAAGRSFLSNGMQATACALLEMHQYSLNTFFIIVYSKARKRSDKITVMGDSKIEEKNKTLREGYNLTRRKGEVLAATEADIHQTLPPLDPPIEFIKFPNPSVPVPRMDPLAVDALWPAKEPNMACCCICCC